MRDVKDYWDRVQTKVCASCIDGDGKGNCRLSEEDGCGLKRFFPDVVEAVLSGRSSQIGPYIDSLREDVCTQCAHQLTDGTCLVREKVDCALDRYFPMIVESIEEVEVEQTARASTRAGAA